MTRTNKHLYQDVSLILFDMDDTLIQASLKLGDYVYQQVTAHGISIEPERKNETERWLLYHWMQPVNVGTDSQTSYAPREKRGEDFWYNHLLLHLRVLGAPSAALEPFARDLAERISTYQTKKELVPSAISTLESLLESGYRLGLLSNRLEAIDGLTEALGISQYFELILSGGEIGFLKPDPRFFYHALDQLSALPEQAVYVGDNYYADVVGAQFAGLTPILVDSNHIFPNAGCQSITALSQLLPLLIGSKRMISQQGGR